MKVCNRCKISKSFDEYHKVTANSDGMQTICKSCRTISLRIWYLKNSDSIRARTKKYYHDNKDKRRSNNKNYTLKTRFSITLDQYNDMLIKQNNVCAICKKPETQIDPRLNRIKALAVDHCHNTKKVRGLLCNQCNTGIGMLKEDKKIFLSAMEYLKI